MSEKWMVLLPEKIHTTGPESIADFAEFVSVAEYGKNAEALIPHIDQFDAIILRNAELTEAVLENADDLKIISKHGAGLDNVDIQTANRRNIIVCNTPGVNSRSVAEHTVSLMMAVRRNLVPADRKVRQGNWGSVQTDWDRFNPFEVQGDVIGLFAFGDIAQEVATIATGLGMDCLTYDPYISEENVGKQVTRVEDKIDLFERSDVISVHSPLTDETYHSIGLRELRALGPEGSIINTARGGVVDEDALRTALEEELLYGAGLDVLEEEPPREDHPLFGEERVVLTPHLGGTSKEATRGMSLQAAENVQTVHEGGIPDSIINREAITESPQSPNPD